VNVSGSKRGEMLKVSGLPLVRVLFPAPFAPAMSVKTEGLIVRKLAFRFAAVRLPVVLASSPVADDLQPPLLSPLARAFGRNPANS
jgi:hypothetical protein